MTEEIKAYEAKQAEIENQLNHIKVLLAEHKPVDPTYQNGIGEIHWGHVADLSKVADLLTKAIQCISA